MSMRPFVSNQPLSAPNLVAVMGLILALFFALLPQGAGAASSGYSIIELRGSKNAHVDVRFDEGTRIKWRSDTEHPLKVRTRGSYAGYIVERLSDGKIVAGAVRVPVMDFDDLDGDEDDPARVVVKSDSGNLAAGTYRIHLVTDGRSTVRFPVEGLDENASYRPKDPTPATSFFKPAPVETGEPVSHHRTPITVKEGTLVILASILVADRSQASYLEHCVVRIIEPCQSRRDHSAQVTITPVDNIWSLSRIISVYKPGHFEPGEWQAQFSASSAGSVRRADMFLLTVDLGEHRGAGGGDGNEPNEGDDEGSDDGPEPSPSADRADDRDNDGSAQRDSGSSNDVPSGGDGFAGDATSVNAASRSSLPFTGKNAGLFLALALGLLTAGVLTISMAKRRS